MSPRVLLTPKAFVLSLALVIFSAAESRSEEPAAAVDQLIAKGENAESDFHSKDALKFYQEAEKLAPENARLMVRIARQYRHLMSDASSTDEKLRLGGIAVQYSRKAVSLDPSDSETHLSSAISYGKVLPFLGSKDRFDAQQFIKSSAEKTLKLDPRSDLGWHVLGRWNARLAGVGTATRTVASLLYGKLPATSYEDAISCFKKAIALNPNRLMHYIELGCAYAETGKNEEARQCLKKGLAMAETEKDDPETKRIGKEMLAKLQ